MRSGLRASRHTANPLQAVNLLGIWVVSQFEISGRKPRARGPIHHCLKVGWKVEACPPKMPWQPTGERMSGHKISGPNALAIEHQAMYRDASGNVRLAQSVNHADPLRPSCVFGPGFLEKLDDIRFLQSGVLSDDGTNPSVISGDRV